MAEQSKLFTRDFSLVFLTRLCFTAFFAMLTATIALYTAAIYDADEALAGIAVGAFVISSLVVRPFAGHYFEVVGRRRMTILGSTLMLGCTLLYLIPVSFPVFVLFRLLHGVGFCVCTNSFNAISGIISPADRFGESMNWLTLANTLGGAIGPFIGVMLFWDVSPQSIFVASAVLSLVPLICAFIVDMHETPLPPEERQRILSSFHLRDCFIMSAVPLCFLIALFDMAYFSITSFQATFAEQLGATQLAPWFFVVASAVSALTRPTMGKIQDRYGDKKIIVPSLVIFSVSLVCLFFAPRCPWLLLVAAVFMSFGRANVFCAGQVLATRNLAPEDMGKGMTTFYLFADTGAGLGPMVFGVLIAPLGGFANMYLWEVLFIAVLVFAFAFVLKRA